MTSTPVLLFIGCGNMGSAIIGGALQHVAGARIVAIDPDLDRARSLLRPGAKVELHADAAAISDLRADLVILGVKPQGFASLSAEIMAAMRRSPTVSIMAGIALDRLQAALAPAPVIRVMPNLPAMVGKGMSVGCTSAPLPDELRGLIEAVFGAIGRFTWSTDEAAFERANPVFACGPGFVFAMAEQMILAAVAQGVPPEQADLLVRQTFLGAAQMLADDPRGAAGLKRAVSSPGGTTLAGLAVVEAADALPKLFPQMLQAAHNRALELSREGV